MVESLQEQVEWFRLQTGTPLLGRRNEVQVSSPERASHDATWGLIDQPWKDDAEEDLEHMARQHLLNKQELEEALAQVGAMSTTIDFD